MRAKPNENQMRGFALCLSVILLLSLCGMHTAAAAHELPHSEAAELLEETNAAERSVTGNQNEIKIYRWLRDTLGCNEAVACGILANISDESKFSPTAERIEKDGRPSYGICQWHDSRLDKLKSFCRERGLNYSSLDAQLRFLQYELKNSEKEAWKAMQGIENTASGAYRAGDTWARKFERCTSAAFKPRAKSAQNTYWPVYAPQGAAISCSCSTSYAGEYVCTVNGDLSIRSDHSTSSARIGLVPGGATVKVTRGNGTWAHVEYNGISGYCGMKYLEKKSSSAKAADKCGCSTQYAGYYVCKASASLNLRSGHGTEYASLIGIPGGTVVYVEKATGSWSGCWGHVTYKGYSGYVGMGMMEPI